MRLLVGIGAALLAVSVIGLAIYLFKGDDRVDQIFPNQVTQDIANLKIFIPEGRSDIQYTEGVARFEIDEAGFLELMKEQGFSTYGGDPNLTVFLPFNPESIGRDLQTNWWQPPKGSPKHTYAGKWRNSGFVKIVWYNGGTAYSYMSDSGAGIGTPGPL